MKISEFIPGIRNLNPLLYYTGLGHAVLFIIFIPLFILDDRLITGINAWIKPMKFALSITIYLWTFAWLLQYVKSVKNVKFISWGIVICMIVEMAIITVQAARGVPSHFNITSVPNAIMFSTMGTFIGINTFLVLYTLILFFTKAVNIPDHITRVAWRAGLLLFFLGGISGGLMVTNLAHTVGAPDGGPGLPFVNWSTVAGDIRAAHFITLHGLQLVPLIIFAFRDRVKFQLPFALITFFLYSALCIALHFLALSGKPIIS
ncbi:MAG: hypothetical protein KF846_04345 [Cyclobacteriaceae bacterium]|nr:hypothetical protein [Cyclobacteriaceae bacterium]MBX2955359.1 hypothetical protein [Cyclobacteriaceae bacterium]